ncbi:uncharacterized protein LOC131947601 [Physella acuta]|uniref:uncharacterized protein LOC131947601 n=1 Tax=Physella acuta TaxID=109671 RepID=UPI0027DE4356|nr:uncharacterized protein LOC131947601 [Physella acuta]
MSNHKAFNISTTTPPVRAVVDLGYERSGIAFLLVVLLGFIAHFLNAVNNGINVIVFFKIGLVDVLFVSLFALSLYDLFFTIIGSIHTDGNITLYIIYHKTLWSRNLILWYTISFKDSTFLFVTYITIPHCCLVTFPLQFKTTFTFRRTYYSLFGISIVNLILHLPILCTQGLMFCESPDVKTTLTFHNLVYPYVCYPLIFICFTFFATQLVSSPKFRQPLRNAATKTPSKLNFLVVRIVKAMLVISLFYHVSCVPC